MIFEKKYRKSTLNSRWLEAIYMRVGYVFDLRFSEWKIQPISMIFGIPTNNDGTLSKCYLFSRRYKNLWEVSPLKNPVEPP